MPDMQDRGDEQHRTSFENPKDWLRRIHLADRPKRKTVSSKVRMKQMTKQATTPQVSARGRHMCARTTRTPVSHAARDDRVADSDARITGLPRLVASGLFRLRPDIRCHCHHGAG